MKQRISHVVLRSWGWVRSNEVTTLLSMLGVVLGTYIFVQVAGEVLEGDTRTFDEWVILNLRQPGDMAEPIGPHWLKTAALDVTALGGVTVLVIMVCVVALYLYLEGMHHAMWLVLAAVLGGQILSSGMKAAFSRERPQIVPHLAEVSTASFPSGHAMMSAVVYLTLGALLMRVTKERHSRYYILSVAVLFTVLIGLTRIYLGVHYPTDVLAGWSLGLVWALLCWLVARHLQRRGKVERAAPASPPIPAS